MPLDVGTYDVTAERTITTLPAQLVLIHADESCLGNQNSEASRGGAGAIVEARSSGTISRHDFFLSSPDTTNNQMALTGAIEILDLLGDADPRPTRHIVYYSDSKYLINGITEWVHSWERRGWRRKGGAVENLALWQKLHQLSKQHHIDWRWVRGHDGHIKNEYADHLAVSAAELQSHSDGLEGSEFDQWLVDKQASNKFGEYDANDDYQGHERQIDPMT